MHIKYLTTNYMTKGTLALDVLRALVRLSQGKILVPEGGGGSLVSTKNVESIVLLGRKIDQYNALDTYSGVSE